MTDRIAVGIIRKAHGVRGEASIEPWTDSPERFEELSSVALVSPDGTKIRAVEIEGTRAHGDRALVKFAGVETPEAVQLLQGWTIEIPEDEARSLDEDEYFIHDLIGLRLFDAEGRDRGVVVDVLEGGGGLLLSVKRADGKTFELPFAADLCTEIDLDAKKIVVNLPEGLDDLNAGPD
jgi:16S rRNA processing protein RimM